MKRLLFAVTETFTIEGRGTVAVGITAEQYGDVRVGDQVELRRPDGSVTVANVVGVEYPPSVKWIGQPPAEPRYGVVLAGVTKDDVRNAEVWIEEPAG